MWTIKIHPNVGKPVYVITTSPNGKVTNATYHLKTDALAAVERVRELNPKAKFEVVNRDDESFRILERIML